MSYDFSVLCADQTEKLQKKLDSINLSFIKEYDLAFNVINNETANEQRLEIFTDIEKLLHDQVTKTIVTYTQTFDRLQQLFARYLSESK